MRFTLPAVLLAAASCSSIAFAQPAPEFTAEAFRSHVAFLSDDLFQGRDTGSKEYELAARYVATQLQGLGLQPGNGDSWFQEVRFGSYTLADGATITVGDNVYAHGDKVRLYPSPRYPDVAVEAPVVFVGYGLDRPDQGFNDYAGLDVKGKIVVMLSGAPQGTPSDIAAHLSSEKSKMAAARGAIGIITTSTLADEKRRPWRPARGEAPHPTLTWLDPQGQAHVGAPAIRFSASMSQEAAATLFAGSGTTLKAVLEQADREGGKPKGRALGKTMKVSQKTESTKFTSPNVIGMLPGSDPSVANEYVLLMAHLDHVGVNPALEGEDKIFNGAMDNATGISTLIEVARAMTETPARPRRPILIAAVTAEEKGLLGSQYLAKNPVLQNGGKVVSVVNLDMPILTYDFQDVIAFGAEHSTMGPIVAKAGESMGVKLIDDPLPQERLFVRSDHYRFVQEGIPSVFLMTGFGNGGAEKFQHFLATDYHKVSDEIDLPFDWQAGAKFARLNYQIAREIADAPQAPRWYQDSFFGTIFAPNQPKAAR